ncbi:hypothetical protein HDU98_004105 [Podochytrium sp. JEL0797]|nr:hypothetical protein HDU98_004105 [Podochytrium sp. JEL0797]
MALFSNTTLAFPFLAPSNATIPVDQVALFTKYTRYAFIAYTSNTSSIESWSCDYCLNPTVTDTTDIAFISSQLGTRPQAYLAVSPSLECIIVSIRGSSSPLDFIKDLNVNPDQLSLPNSPANVSVHSGFWNAWSLLSGDIESALMDKLQRYPDYNVTFVGHSLGASVALLAGVDLTSRGVLDAQRVHVVNMGQPRVGNPAFGDFVKGIGFAEVSRIVHYNDIVPHLPPLSDSYRQEITEFWIKQDGVTVTCNDVLNDGEDKNCSNLPSVLANLSTKSHLTYFNITVPGDKSPFPSPSRFVSMETSASTTILSSSASTAVKGTSASVTATSTPLAPSESNAFTATIAPFIILLISSLL